MAAVDVSWFAWGLMVVGFLVATVGTLVGPPRPAPAPRLMGAAAAMLSVGFTVSLVTGLSEDEPVVALRYAALLALLLVLVLVTRARHVRAGRLSA